MQKRISLLVVGLALLLTSQAQAQITPLAVSIFPPVQFPPEHFSVVGLRLSALWGEHQGVSGVDLGVAGNITTHDFTGVGISGLFNVNGGETRILLLQAAGLVNYNSGKLSVYGVQLAPFTNYLKGEGFILGLQAGLVNFAPATTIAGLQLGLYNRARTVSGLQIGLINDTETLHGLQIGLLNFHTKGLFSVSPILNFGF